MKLEKKINFTNANRDFVGNRKKIIKSPPYSILKEKRIIFAKKKITKRKRNAILSLVRGVYSVHQSALCSILCARVRHLWTLFLYLGISLVCVYILCELPSCTDYSDFLFLKFFFIVNTCQKKSWLIKLWFLFF